MQTIKKSWMSLVSVAGYVLVITFLIRNRRRLKFRCIKSIKWLRGVSKAIGKIIIIVRRIRMKSRRKV